MQAPSIEARLGRFAADLQLADIAPAAVEAFDRLVLDFVAVVVAGLGDPGCMKAAETFGGLSRPRASAPAMAFALGTCAHWFDWDDTDDRSHVHGGAVIFSALLALWNSGVVAANRREPREFTAAAVAAYEIACRIGAHLKDHGHRGWMPTGSGATIGAAAAGARLAGGDASYVTCAMGIAAANAGLSRQALADKKNAKGILAGVAAKSAVEAVMLAASGVQGPPHFLNGPYGLGALHAMGAPMPAELVNDLGERFFIEAVSLKPYPCCRSTHAVIDAVLDLRTREPALAGRVQAIDVTAPSGVVERCGAPFSVGNDARLSAQFSIPYTAALALRTGRIALSDFTPEQVRAASGQMHSMLSSIRVRAAGDAQADTLVPVDVRFSSEGVVTAERRVRALKGDRSMPLTTQEQSDKLRVATEGVLAGKELAHAEAIARNVRIAGPEDLIAWLTALAMERARAKP